MQKPIPHLLLYSASMLCIKLSILLFVRRLAGAACSGVFKKVIKWFFVLNVMFSVSCWVMYICQCIPVAAGFNLNLRFRPGTVCKDYTLAFWITSAIHSLSDLTMLALPIYMVLGLQMTWRKKAAVIMTFLIGGLACVCSMIRMAWIGTWGNSYDLSCNHTSQDTAIKPANDCIGDACYPTVWGQLEATFSITAISLPAIKVLFQRVVPSIISTGREYSSDPYHSEGGSGLRSKGRDSLSESLRQKITQQRRISQRGSYLSTLEESRETIVASVLPSPPEQAITTAEVNGTRSQQHPANDSELELIELGTAVQGIGREPSGSELELEQRSRTKDYRVLCDRVEWKE